MMIDKKLLERIQKETSTNYGSYDVVGGDENNTYIPMDSIEPMLEDLLIEIERLNERIDDIIQDRNDNYKPIPVADQVDVYHGYFI